MSAPDDQIDSSLLSATKPQGVLDFVENLIAFYAAGLKKYGARLYWLKILGVGSSVTVTVLSGISGISKGFPWIITIVAGLSTLMTTVLAATKAQEYYVLSGENQGKIKAEKLLFLGGGGPYSNENTEEGRLRLLSERVYQIYEEGRLTWKQINKPER